MVANIKIVAITLIMATTVSPAMADNYLGQPELGVNLDNYFALDVGQTTATKFCSGLSLTGCKNTATLVRVAIGTQITPMWGAEISYGDLGKASAGTLGSVPLDWQISALQFSGTGTFPLSGAFSLIGKLEIVQARATVSSGGISSSGSNTSLGVGIGAQYDFTKSVAIRFQYEDLGTFGDPNVTGNTNVTLLSAGIVVGWF